MMDTPIPLVDPAAAKLVLAELQRQNDAHLDSSEGLDDKAVSLLGWASLTMAIVSALSMKDLATAVQQAPPFYLLLATVLLYTIIVAVGLGAFFPRRYELPVGINWDELCDYYLVPGEQDALEQLLSQYLAVIERNKRASYRKAWLLRIGLTLLPFLILALVALATHSLWLDYLP